VRVQTATGIIAVPWDSAQAFLARCRAGRDDVPRIVQRFQAVGTSRPVELDPTDVAVALEVLDAWAVVEELPPGVPELREALRSTTA
jgi:hypothetical protein